MNKKLIIITLMFFLSLSCKSKMNEVNQKTGENLKVMLEELQKKFPEPVSFQSIMFSFDEALGNTLLVKIAGNADSSKIHEWFYINGMWESSTEKIMEDDSLAFTDHFFTSGTDYKLSTLIEVLSLATEKAEEDKDLDNYMVRSINLSMGNQLVNNNKMENLVTQVTIESKADNKRYLANFNSQGSFISILEE